MAAHRIYEVRSNCEYLDITNGAAQKTIRMDKNKLVATYKHFDL